MRFMKNVFKKIMYLIIAILILVIGYFIGVFILFFIFIIILLMVILYSFTWFLNNIINITNNKYISLYLKIFLSAIVTYFIIYLCYKIINKLFTFNKPYLLLTVLWIIGIISYSILWNNLYVSFKNVYKNKNLYVLTQASYLEYPYKGKFELFDFIFIIVITGLIIYLFNFFYTII